MSNKTSRRKPKIKTESFDEIFGIAPSKIIYHKYGEGQDWKGKR
jgi:hypothetical protein